MLSEKTKKYFEEFDKEVKKVYEMAGEAKKKGLDPVDKVEVPLAMTMAQKCVELIATLYPQMSGCGIDERMIEFEEMYGKLDPTVVFKIAEEVAKQKFCEFENILQAIDAGIRLGFAYQTIGVVASPIEGYTEFKVEKTRDGKEYFKAYFSGPIRSAGTTASCVVLMLIDYMRELFGYAKFDPSEEEAKRYVTENTDYHERISNLQYFPLEEEMLFLAKHLPIQLAGDPTTQLEVSNYKNLDRVETNFVRGGMCLIFSEGLAQKAAKGFRLYNKVKGNGIKMTGFDWIPEYLELHEKLTSAKGKKLGDNVPVYIKDLVAGRPIFGHPARSGAFRFRYGRGRTSGFSAASLHPATMAITDDFIADGTQLKIEKPTKGCIVTSCDSIDGPIVKLNNGSVKKLKTRDEARKIYRDVDEIIYSGDILFPFSDVLNRNANLIKPGYVEEWWNLELEKAGGKVGNFYEVELEKAVELSKEYKIPLHPSYIFYWTQISKGQFLDLVNWLNHSIIRGGKVVFPFNKTEQEKFEIGKRGLELLGVEHEVTTENVVLSKKDSKALFVNLGLNLNLLKEEEQFLKEIVKVGDFKKELEVLEIVNSVSEFVIKDKAGVFIGSRMGRPEKAKLRKLTGSPNVLFPIGKEGGRLRSLQAACEVGKVRSSFPLRYCNKCKKETIYPSCEICGGKCVKMFYSREDKEKLFEQKEGYVDYCTFDLDINHYFNKAVESLGLGKNDLPLLIKGIRGTSSEGHVMEHLAKGVLRARHGLQVNKDGTIRVDGTETPIVCFKPEEIFVSVEKLKEIGYDKDIYGNDLVDKSQILELMPHDILLPCCPDSGEEKSDDVFLKVCNFVDEELEKFYKLKSFHNVKTRNDLVGQLGVFMAPHNCGGVICRFIGFTKTQGLYASPYMHAAVRRDCFDYNTFITINQNGIWNNRKIGEIVEELNPRKIVDGYETKEIEVKNYKTIGVGKKIEEVCVNNFTKHEKQKMFKIKTALGKEISVTENHKFLINDKIKRMSDLRIGDKLPLSYKININSKDKKQINLLECLSDENLMVRGIGELVCKVEENKIINILNKLKITKKQFMNFKLRDSYPCSFVLMLDKETQNKIFKIGKIAAKRDNIELPIVVDLGNELLEVIGLYIAEGYSRSVIGKKGLNQVYIASNDLNLRKFIKKVIKKYFGLVPSEKKEDRVTFSSCVFYLFISKILGCGSIAREKRIPSLFLDLPLDRLACVLRGYYEGDGSVSLSDRRVSCDSVSEGLLYDLEFCLARFGIFSKKYEYEKLPGPKVKEFYVRKDRKIPLFKITKLIIGSDFVKNFGRIGFLSKRKNKILNYHLNKKSFLGMRIEKDENFVYDSIISIEDIGEKESYCLNVDTKNHLVLANSIMSRQCDGDEAAIMLLSDVLLNFSRKFLPSHRGGTQDAPLVLNSKIDAGEVDDQILDFELSMGYPLELYEKAEKELHSSEVKEIEIVSKILREGRDPFVNIGFTHDTKNINEGVLCSAYKLLPTMKDKVEHQMALVEKLRCVDEADTARLMIERHFMRDMRGNLRKFSMQGFRCVGCNEIMRRLPLTGVCPRCRGKIIFTIHEGGIKKYLEIATDLAKKYNLSTYMQQNLELVKRYIESIFGKELEKQKALDEFF